MRTNSKGGAAGAAACCATITTPADTTQRTSALLSTRDPDSEISRLERAGSFPAVPRARPGACALRALGKADWRSDVSATVRVRSTHQRRCPWQGVHHRSRGRDRTTDGARHRRVPVECRWRHRDPWPIVRDSVADPAMPYDNAPPMARLVLQNAAVATSGMSARGAHLIDARTGQPARLAAAATVVARDTVTANALATTLCIAEADEGLSMAEQARGAEALHISPEGIEQRTSGFVRWSARAHASRPRPRNRRTGPTAIASP